MTYADRYFRNLNASRELRQISASEAQAKDTSIRHKCFLSYHAEDSVEVLDFVNSYSDVFIPRAIGLTDEDPIVNSNDVDYVMQCIRDKYLADSTVTLVMVGNCTWARKYVDWEVYSTLRRDKNNRLSGLAAIELPSVADSGKLPERVNDNVNESSGYARWWKYPSTSGGLRQIIQEAFDARETKDHLIDNTRSRRLINGSCS